MWVFKHLLWEHLCLAKMSPRMISLFIHSACCSKHFSCHSWGVYSLTNRHWQYLLTLIWFIKLIHLRWAVKTNVVGITFCPLQREREREREKQFTLVSPPIARSQTPSVLCRDVSLWKCIKKRETPPNCNQPDTTPSAVLPKYKLGSY